MAGRTKEGASMPFNLRGPELLVLVLIILLLFGAKRLPDVARGLGRSLRIFKAETKDLQGADAPDAADAPAAVEGKGAQPTLPAAPADEATPAPAKPQAERAES
jgi:sec-independent protein translocase protein TatA